MPILDTRGVLLLDAATFLASAALLTLLPSPKRDAPTGTSRGTFLDDTLAGLRYIWTTPMVRAISLGFFAIVAFNGIDDVALVFLATDTLGGGDSAVGLLLAAVGIGIAAALAYLLGGLLIDLTTARIAFLVGGAGGLLATLAVEAAFRRSPRGDHNRRSNAGA